MRALAMRPRLILLVIVALTLVLSGCANADWVLDLRNNTSEVWHLRWENDPGQPNVKKVTRMHPGFSGPGALWVGGPVRTIELLDSDCNLVGVFEATDDGTQVVSGVIGIEGRVRPFNVFSDNGNFPDLEVTRDCGGFV